MAKSVKSNNEEVSAETPMLTCLYLSYTPCYFDHDGKEYSLHNNETYQLPDCEFVRSLIGQGRLVEKK